MSHLTAVSYNVHQWVGTDKQYDPDRGLSVLREIGANIIGLQEVNFPKHIPHRISAKQLAEELGMRLIVGKTLMRQHAAYGNVLLTDRPVDAIRRHDISVERREPRGVLDIDLITDSGLIRVLNTHLGLRASERRRQYAALGDILQSIGNREMTILMGDLNEWLPIRLPFRKIMANFDHLTAPPSFPTFFPFLALDRILIRPHQRVIAMHVHKSRLARIASDHYPVVAAFNVR